MRTIPVGERSRRRCATTELSQLQSILASQRDEKRVVPSLQTHSNSARADDDCGRRNILIPSGQVRSGVMRFPRVVLASVMLGGVAVPAVVAPVPAAAAVAGSRFVALIPDRILDTRPGLVPGDGIDGPIGPSSSVLLTVAGRSGVPSTGVTAARALRLRCAVQ